MRRIDRPSGVTTWLTWIALSVVLILIALAGIGIVQTASDLAVTYPEFASLQAPFVTAALAFGLCVMVLLVLTGVLVGYIRDDRIFRPAALRLVDALVITVVIATVLVAVVIPFIPGPPVLFLAMVAGVLMGTTAFLVLVVLRSLLRRAVSMRVELDEVV